MMVVPCTTACVQSCSLFSRNCILIAASCRHSFHSRLHGTGVAQDTSSKEGLLPSLESTRDRAQTRHASRIQQCRSSKDDISVLDDTITSNSLVGDSSASSPVVVSEGDGIIGAAIKVLETQASRSNAYGRTRRPSYTPTLNSERSSLTTGLQEPETLRTPADAANQEPATSSGIDHSPSGPDQGEAEQGPSNVGVSRRRAIPLTQEELWDASQLPDKRQSLAIRPAAGRRARRRIGPEVDARVRSLVIAILNERGDSPPSTSGTADSSTKLSSAKELEPLLASYLEQLGPGGAAWDQVMKELERRGARHRALQVFQFLEKQEQAKSGQGLVESNLTTILSILGREGKVGLARSIHEKVPRALRSVYSFSALMSGYVKQGLFSGLWELFDKMQEEKVQPNLVTYNIVIHACAKQADMDAVSRAWTLFDKMVADGITPDHITYNTMVHVAVRGGQLDRASGMLAQMKDMGCRPNVVTYTALLAGLGRGGRLEEAASLFLELKAAGLTPNAFTYNALIRAFGRGGQLDRAGEVYREMTSAGVEPDVWTYNTLLDAFGRGGRFDEAEEVLETMQRQGCSPDRVTFNTLLDAYSKAGQYAMTLRVLDRMREAGCVPDIWTYNILLDTCGKTGRLSEAESLMADLKAAGHKPNIVTFSALISAYGRNGRYEDAQRVFAEMKAAGCTPNAMAYNGLMDAYAHHGLHTEAQNVFWELQRQGLEPDVTSFTTLMDAYGRAGRPDEAKKLLQVMISSGYEPDCVAYGVVARAFILMDREEEAEPYLLLLNEVGSKDSRLCRQLASEYGLEGYESGECEVNVK